MSFFDGEDDEESVIFPYDVTVVAETEKGIKIAWGSFLMTQHWVPKSQIAADSEVWKKGQKGKLVVREWFANECEWFP